MWNKFRWDMFITSFLPLWASIIITDIWSVIEILSNKWNYALSWVENLRSNIFLILLQSISVIIVILAVSISIIGIKKFLKQKENSSNTPIGKITRAEKTGNMPVEFLVAYILPLIAFDFSSLMGVALFLIYFSLLAFLSIRNNYIYTNILLEFKKYKMYNCDIMCNVMNLYHNYNNSLIISKVDLTQYINKEISYWDCENKVYIAMEKNDE